MNWACDGTFKTSPSLLFQLITIHAIIRGLCVPRLFALLPDKKEQTYVRLFTSIRNLRINCQPETCLMDFEQAMHNAFVSVFFKFRSSRLCFSSWSIYLTKNCCTWEKSQI